MESSAYRPGDEHAILALYELAFRRPMTLDYWNWRYRDNPAGGPLIELMWEGDLLVGHYAVSPVGMLLDGQPSPVALSMTTMTHPAYNGRGIFTTLAESLYGRLRDQHGLRAVYGFPNAHSHRGFVKNLAWQDLTQLPVLSLAPRPAATTADPRVRVLAGGFTEGHAAAARAVNSHYGVSVHRTPAYLDWRYRTNPAANYETLEWTEGETPYYVVTKRFPSFDLPDRQEVDLLDLAVPADPALLVAFVGAVLAHYAPHQPARLNLWLPLHDPRHLELEKLGFQNLAPITYAGVRVLAGDAALLQHDRAWGFHFGDSDVY